jgi:hypothetical protein
MTFTHTNHSARVELLLLATFVLLLGTVRRSRPMDHERH